MSGPIRLIVSDIDGTLLRQDKTLSDDVISAVGRARMAGIAVSLISARPPSGMLWIAKRLELTGVIGAFNGGTIVRPDGTIVSADQLEPECAARALALLEHPAVTPWLFSGGLWYAQATDDVYVPRERRAASCSVVLTSRWEAIVALTAACRRTRGGLRARLCCTTAVAEEAPRGPGGAVAAGAAGSSGGGGVWSGWRSTPLKVGASSAAANTAEVVMTVAARLELCSSASSPNAAPGLMV